MPTLEEREEHCRGLLSKDTLAGRLSADLDPDGLAERMAAESEGLTLAYLKEIFVSAALRRANERVTLMDDAFLDAALEAAGELRTHLRRVRDPDSLAEMRPGREVLGFR